MALGTGPTLAETGADDKRLYHWGNRIVNKPDLKAATEDFPSVTTVLSLLDKPALPVWYANTVTQNAMKTVDSWRHRIADIDWDTVKSWSPKQLREDHPEIFAVYQELRKQPERLRDSKGHRGTAIHELLDLTYGQGMRMEDAYEKLVGDIKFAGFKNERLDDVARPLVDFFQREVREMVAAEGTVYNTRHLYAGSFDAMCLMKDGSLAIVDYKTANRVYDNNSLQLTAYSMCDKIAEPLPPDHPSYEFHTDDPVEQTLVELKDLPTADYGLLIHLPGNQKAHVYRTEFTKDQEKCVIGLRNLWGWQQINKREGWYASKDTYNTMDQDLLAY